MTTTGHAALVAKLGSQQLVRAWAGKLIRAARAHPRLVRKDELQLARAALEHIEQGGCDV